MNDGTENLSLSRSYVLNHKFDFKSFNKCFELIQPTATYRTPNYQRIQKFSIRIVFVQVGKIEEKFLSPNIRYLEH